MKITQRILFFPLFLILNSNLHKLKELHYKITKSRFELKSFEFLGFVKVEDKKEERENEEKMKLAILARSICCIVLKEGFCFFYLTIRYKYVELYDKWNILSVCTSDK